MEKNVHTAPELSKEQLQEITGGCMDCVEHLRYAQQLQTSAAYRIAAVREQPDRPNASDLLNVANRDLTQVRAIHNLIISKGHVDTSQLPQVPQR